MLSDMSNKSGRQLWCASVLRGGGLWQDALEVFCKAVPVARELRNPAMRPRHWVSLSETLNTVLDPSSETLTLGVLLDVNIQRHADMVVTLSLTATKELAIEQTLTVRSRPSRALPHASLRSRPF